MIFFSQVQWSKLLDVVNLSAYQFDNFATHNANHDRHYLKHIFYTDNVNICTGKCCMYLLHPVNHTSFAQKIIF